MTTSMKILVCVLIAVAGALPAAADPYQPPQPQENGWDWIRMTSGEWLGGELNKLRDRDLEFDSDELDLLELDWADVSELYSPRILSYRFEDLGVFTGTAVMRADTIAVATITGTHKLPRSRLITIIEGELKEINYWSARASIGFVGRTGNTEQTDLNTTMRIRRLTPRTRGLLDYAGNYGTVDGDETINNTNLALSFDFLISAGFFITPISLNFSRDPFQNIDLKSTIAAGVGYVLMRDGDVEWDVGLSGGYRATEYMSVEEGEDPKPGNGTIIPYTNVEWDITDDLECIFDFRAEIGLPDTQDSFYHSRLSFSLDIWGDILDFDVSAIWDRAQSPKPDADGNVPEKDDLRTTFGIALDF